MQAVFAFVGQDLIEEYGAYAGIAAIPGLALLSLLYFAQAREVKRLREWAGRAPERDAELQERIAAQATAGRSSGVRPIPRPAASGRPAAGPSPAVGAGPPRPATGSQPAARPAAAAAAGAAPASRPATAAAGQREGTAPPGADQGAPAAPGPGGAPDEPAKPAPAGAPAERAPAAKPGAPGAEPAARPDGPPADRVAPGVPAAAPATAAAAGAAGAAARAADGPEAEKRAAAAAPSALREREEGAPAAAPARPPAQEPDARPAGAGPPRPGVARPLRPDVPRTAAAGRPTQAIRRGPGPGAPPRAPVASRRDEDAGDRRRGIGARSLALLAAGAVVLALGAIFAVTRLGGDDDGPERANTVQEDPATRPARGDRRQAGAPVNRGEVTVAVLNGTTVPGLAAQVSDQIEADGFQKGTVTNAADQQRQTTTVYYGPGERRAAQEVARLLKVSDVEPLDAGTQAISGGEASVVVVVGADRTP